MKSTSITVDLMLVINKNKDTHHKYQYKVCKLYIVKFFVGFDTLFWPIFVDFQNEAASLCLDNSINKDMHVYYF